MGNYISSKYNYYFENHNKYKRQITTEELLNSPMSSQSFDLDCPDIFENNMVIIPNNENILNNSLHNSLHNSLDNSFNNSFSNPLNNLSSSNLDNLKKRYQELLIYNSYLKLEYNNCLKDNDIFCDKIDKLERENLYFKQKIYKINNEENPYKNRRKTI